MAASGDVILKEFPKLKLAPFKTFELNLLFRCRGFSFRSSSFGVEADPASVAQSPECTAFRKTYENQLAGTGFDAIIGEPKASSHNLRGSISGSLGTGSSSILSSSSSSERSYYRGQQTVNQDADSNEDSSSPSGSFFPLLWHLVIILGVGTVCFFGVVKFCFSSDNRRRFQDEQEDIELGQIIGDAETISLPDSSPNDETATSRPVE